MKDRTVIVRWLQPSAVTGEELFAVSFMNKGVEVAHWPILGGLALATIIEDWIVRGNRPDAIKATIGKGRSA